jgi:hypothetical protein
MGTIFTQYITPKRGQAIFQAFSRLTVLHYQNPAVIFLRYPLTQLFSPDMLISGFLDLQNP